MTSKPTLEPTSKSGKLLWQLLPAVYRNRDGSHDINQNSTDESQQPAGDLANYLDAYGILLDQVKNTILQRLADTSPETCQEWLIPYFADLLDVHLVSPDIEGQRVEVARAISWRQRKGTIACAREIAREVGRYEKTVSQSVASGEPLNHQTVATVVVQEGFRRVATTTRIGTPLPSLKQLGLTQDDFKEQASTSPLYLARRPGLPAGTVDFRYLSRAREVTEKTPVSQLTGFANEARQWQQEFPRGMPCIPDTYQDVSVRTVDTRKPNWKHGYYHPHRSLFFTEPREGYFPAGRDDMPWTILWEWFALFDATTDRDRPFSTREDNDGQVKERLLARMDFEQTTWLLIERNREKPFIKKQRIIGMELSDTASELSYRKEQVGDDEYLLQQGFELVKEELAEENVFDSIGIRLPGLVSRRVVIMSLRGFGDSTMSISTENHTIHFSSLVQANSYLIDDLVIKGHILFQDAELVRVRRSAIEVLTVNTFSLAAVRGIGQREYQQPGINIIDSLIAKLIVADDVLCRLEYCTILNSLECTDLEASDCILVTSEFSSIQKLYLRHSCVPWFPVAGIPLDKGRAHEQSITRDSPLFLSREFGKPGCGVLHPAAVPAIRQGAEDGGEMGTYHHRHYVLREQAVIDKLQAFLPVTQQPVLIVHRDWGSPV